ncbi:MAG: cation diffusion facilitator family transporter [Acidobacteria bacterium]|nr:cation diffusion facilitator family transporter [Acidobacteriota bacterium]
MHTHSHSPSTGRNLQFSLWLTAAFIVVELLAGVQADSLALLSDAGHNFTDTLSLLLAWFAYRWQQRPPNKTKTYGYHRAGVLAAFVNALVLVVLSLYIFWESYQRLLNPTPVEEMVMIVVAAAGLAVNVIVMRALHADSKNDLNIRGAFLHMLGDALSSVGIIIGAIVMSYTPALWIDPALSALIGALILWSAWGVIGESLNILLEGSPRGLEWGSVQAALRSIDGVSDVHDLHIWSLSSNSHALSCHAVIGDMPPSESRVILGRIHHVLDEKFRIQHATVQFESAECAASHAICTGDSGDNKRPCC